MQIQSLSVDVPAKCPNDCYFCVAKMNQEDYANQIEKNLRFRQLYKDDYKKRLLFARDNGCNTVILTGNGEPLMNRTFLEDFGEWNNNLPLAFRCIELQTSGVMLDDEKLRFLRNSVGVSTISLSISDVFSSKNNALYNRTPDKLVVDIDVLCKEIKRYDFNLRLSLNMTDFYNERSVEDIFNRCKILGADQITFRKLYLSKNETPQNEWIEKHCCDESILSSIDEYIRKNGRALEKLSFGAIRYSVNEMSVVLDDDCMSESVKDTMKFMILRPNAKLYSKWDDKGSLIF
jgi:molybdenum cofactor biosynthesis enzyme MoaA